jgi:hypothetical protein
MPNDVEEVSVISELIESHFDEVHTMMPGEVVNFDHTKELATIRPLVHDAFSAELPDVPGVTICWPGNYWKLAAGETGILLFSESDFSTWWRGEVSDPPLVLRHGINGSVFIPGIKRKGQQRSFNGTSEIIVPGPVVRLGSSAAGQKLIKGNAYTGHESTFLTAMWTWVGIAAAAIKANGTDIDAPSNTFKTAITTFQGQLSGDLSDVSKTD